MLCTLEFRQPKTMKTLIEISAVSRQTSDPCCCLLSSKRKTKTRAGHVLFLSYSNSVLSLNKPSIENKSNQTVKLQQMFCIFSFFLSFVLFTYTQTHSNYTEVKNALRFSATNRRKHKHLLFFCCNSLSHRQRETSLPSVNNRKFPFFRVYCQLPPPHTQTLRHKHT